MLNKNHTQQQANKEHKPATIFIDGTASIVYANDKFCQMLGYTHNELFNLGKYGIIKLIHPEERQIILDRFADTNYKIMDKLVEPQRLIKKDGTVVSTMKTVKSSQDNDGNKIIAIVEYVEIVSD